MSEVVITRRGTDIGVNDDKRVYVTGPHFGTLANALTSVSSIFSSTLDRAEASRYTREQAERLLRQGKWRNNQPQIEDAS